MDKTINLLNQITAKLGGTTTHKYNINALNEWCTLQSGSGGHVYDIDAYNELDVINGGSGGHTYVIDALNSMDVAVGGSGGFVFIGLALASLGTLLNPIDPPQQDLFLPTGTIVTKDGNMIVLTTDSNFVLTVDGFQPFELLMSGGIPMMSNEKFISK